MSIIVRRTHKYNIIIKICQHFYDHRNVQQVCVGRRCQEVYVAILGFNGRFASRSGMRRVSAKKEGEAASERGELDHQRRFFGVAAIEGRARKQRELPGGSARLGE
jgi:hypothetical protein